MPETAPTSPTCAATPTLATPVLELSRIRLFRGDTTIIDDLSWRIGRGEHWAVLGPNGSGKTSLLNIASGALWPSAGEVRLLGEAFGGTDLRELRKRIGWVSAPLRDRVPSYATALETVLTGLDASIGMRKKRTRDEVARAEFMLHVVGCSDRARHEFGTLSQGEQQKVLIGRALMADPELLVLDEICAGLDLAARERFLALLGELAGQSDGPTLILVTHHVEEIMPSFTHALVLRDGAVVAQGPRNQVLTDAILSEALGLPLKLEDAGGRLWPRVR